jgi:hypothetical protein
MSVNKGERIMKTFNDYLSELPEINILPKPETKIITITPEIAQKLLARSTGNRPINEGRIVGYAFDMKNGNWHMCSDTIDFDIDGRLIDGHHTLLAALRANFGIDCTIRYNLPRDTILGIDRGQPRSPGQMAVLCDGEYTGRMFPVAKFLEYGVTEGRSRNYISYEELVSLVKKYEEPIRFVVEHSGHSRNMTSSFMAAVSRAWYYVDDTLLIRFIDIVKNGMPESNEEWAADRLRTFLLENPKGLTPGDVYWRTEVALYHFSNHRPIKQLKPAEHELFPLKINPDGSVSPSKTKPG